MGEKLNITDVYLKDEKTGRYIRMRNPTTCTMTLDNSENEEYSCTINIYGRSDLEFGGTMTQTETKEITNEEFENVMFGGEQ